MSNLLKNFIRENFLLVPSEAININNLMSNHYIIIQVTDGVHIAVGFSAANLAIIEAPDGLIIVDVTDHPDNAKRIIREFRKISKQPIKAFVYTHSHPDHIGGGAVCSVSHFMYTTHCLSHTQTHADTHTRARAL